MTNRYRGRVDLRRHCARSTTIGSVVWLGWAGLAGQPLLVDLFLLSPLVLAPLVLRCVLALDSSPGTALQTATLAQLPAAALGCLSFLLDPGPLAACLTLPWACVTVAMAVHAAARARARASIGPPAALAVDAGLAYVVVGAAWWAAARLGWSPLGFSPVIVFLTAVHFHFAGFCLPVLAGLGARRLGGRAAPTAALGVVVGVPLVAAGITFAPAVEVAGALVTASAAFAVGVGQIRHAAGHPGGRPLPRFAAALLALSGLSVMFGMVVAAIYGIGEYVQRPWPSIPEMIPMHGAINALGFCLLGLWGWNLNQDDDAATDADTEH